MQKNSNRKGLALGAVFALVASLFVGVTPASAAATDGANIAIRPAEGTTLVGTVLEDFPVYAQLLPGVSNDAFASKLSWKIVKASGTNMDVVYSTSAVVSDIAYNKTPALVGPAGSESSASGLIQAGSTSATVSGLVASGVGFLNFKAYSTSDAVSWSDVVLSVTAWIDEAGSSANGVVDADEWFTTATVSMKALASIGASVTTNDPADSDTKLTVSATVTGINFENLGTGKFFLSVSSSDNIFNGATVKQDSSSPIGGATLAARGGVVSSSFTVGGVSKSDSISAAIKYVPSGTAGTYTAGYNLGTVVKKLVVDPGLTTLALSVASSAHSTASGAAAAVRPNQLYTIRVLAKSTSATVSKVVTVALSGDVLDTTTPKRIRVNGGEWTTSYPTALAVTTAATGYGTFTLETEGFAATNVVNVDASVANVSATQLVLTATAPYYTVVNDYDLVLTKPGTAITLNYSVKDQWQVLSAATDQRLKITRKVTSGAFQYTTTVSYVAVTAGKAAFSFLPEPGTATGSAAVGAELQTYNAGTFTWAAASGAIADSDVAVKVSATADAISGSATASVSSSISYSISDGVFMWSNNAITGYAANPGSVVEVSAAGLYFLDTVTEDTASATIAVRANADGLYSFKAASGISGTHTISITVNGSTTTSQLVVDDAAADKGKTITFDTTAISAGATATITGTLVDANGNPVYTTDSADIVVSYTGAGIPIGTMPTTTDEDGEFSFTVLTGAADKGTATVTAVYRKSGAATAAADKLSFAQAITVGAAAAVVVADQKLTIGTFNGYIAIYAKGYEGQKLSYKVAGKWGTVASLDAFQRVIRKTGAGYEIKVDLYIDGVFAKTQTTLTK